MEKSLVEIFNFNGTDVTTIVDQNKNPWWVANEVCDILGLADRDKQIRRLDLDEKQKFRFNPTISRGNPNRWIINEPGLYRLIFKSRKPEAKAFQRWVYHEVIPAVMRKQASSLDKMSIREQLILAGKELEKLDVENKQLTEKVVEMKPKAEVYDNFITDSNECVGLRHAAKLLDVKPRAFGEQLENHGIMYKANTKMETDGDIFYGKKYKLPYQQYIDKGYFVVKPFHRNYRGLDVFTHSPYITSKGLAWLDRKISTGEISLLRIGQLAA